MADSFLNLIVEVCSSPQFLSIPSAQKRKRETSDPLCCSILLSQH
jgi:hypothetical protein